MHSPGILTYVINLMLCDNEMVDDVGGYEGVTRKCIEPEYRTAWIEPYKRHFLKGKQDKSNA